jgi:pSer/pThr/pTyr-binding forkhead associated (FHA) protein
MAIIGREAPADIVLPYPQVSTRHAFLEAVAPSVFRVVDLGSSNGTFVAGARVTEAVVSAGADLRLGSLPFPWREFPHVLAAEEREPAGLVIGREPPADVVLADPRVSTRHAKVIPQGDCVFLKDLGSTNGTFVNGRPISVATVTRGDSVSLGSLPVDVFRIVGGHPATTPRAPGEMGASIPLGTPGGQIQPPEPVRPPTPARRPLSALAKRNLAIAAGVAVLAAGVGFWYYTARRAFEAHAGRLQSALARLEDGRQAWLPDPVQPPQGALDSQAVAAYVATVKSGAPGINDTIQRLRDGEGTSFWLPRRRSEMAASGASRLALEEEAARDAEAALSPLASTASSTSEALATAHSLYEKATGALSPQSDSSDFRGAAEEMVRSGKAIASTRTAVGTLLDGSPQGGRPEAFRRGLLVGFVQSLTTAEARAKGRGASLQQADVALGEHKGRMLAAVAEGADLLERLNAVARQLAPAVRTAYEQTQPLLQMIRQAEEPLPGTEVLDLMGAVTGRGSGGGAGSPLGLMRAVSPETGMTIDVLKATCGTIETLHDEAAGLSQAADRLIPAVHGFSSERSRAAMLQVAQAAPEAAAYFDSRKGLFDPAIEKLAELRRRAGTFRSAAFRVPVPLARDMLLTIVDGATAFLNTAEEPFQSARASMETTANALRQVESMENQYVQRLRDLAGQ